MGLITQITIFSRSLVVRSWIIERGELDWKRAFTGLNAGFARVCRYQSGLPGVKVTALGIHQFKTDRMIRKVCLRMVSVWHQRCNIHGCHNFRYIRFRTAQACFYLRLRIKTYRFGHTPVEGRSTVQEVSPEQSLCGTRGTTVN